MSQKEVTYIDVEDDITTIIDKATKGDAKIVALVLPKKTPTLKSSVNMKLLKNSIDKAKKKTVLITKESSLLPLAGAAGMHVASDLKSRPSVPSAPKAKQDDHVIETSGESDDLTDAAPTAELAEEIGDGDQTKKDHKAPTKKGQDSKKSSKIKIPNFDKFRLKMILAFVATIVLAVGWYVMFRVMPKANIVIQAQTSKVSTDISFKLDATLAEPDLEANLLNGEVKEIKKTVTERFEATGEKDVGQKSSGLVTVQNCDSSDDVTLSAGTVFTDDVTGFSFVSSAAVTVPGGSFSGGGCSTPGEQDVAVIASVSGDGKNLSPRAYDVDGVSGLITGFGGQMSGGTSDIVKVVSDVDISNAKQTLLNKTDQNIKAELTSLFDDQLIVVEDTFNTSNTEPVSTVTVDTEATEASISAEFTYTMLGVSKDNLSKLLEKDQLAQIDADALSIIDGGIDRVSLEVDETENNQFTIRARTDSFVGPEIDVEALSQEIAGQKYSQVIETIKAKPGVRDVTVDLAPFWVFSAPGAEKITITIEVSDDQPL